MSGKQVLGMVLRPWGGTVIALIAAAISLSQCEHQARASRAEQIDRAFARLVEASKDPNVRGVGEALELLHAEGRSLKRTILNRAWLEHVSLPGANLQYSEFIEAQLNGSDLSRASLNPSCLNGADLQGVSFRGTRLERADLRYVASVERADFEGARLHWADLRGARGLTCDQLTSASGWQSAFRDPSLACGASIPEPKHDDPFCYLGAR